MKNLIIGGSSKIGRNLNFRNYKFDFTFCKNKLSNGIYLDLTKDISNQIDLENYNAIIILSAISDPRICEENKEYSNLLNVISIKKLINLCNKKNKKIIFFSTDYIFDGTKGNYSEIDKGNPINLYGEQKYEIENYLEQNCSNYTILRISKTFFSNLQTTCFLNNLIQEIRNSSGVIKCIEKQIFSPIFIDDIAEVIEDIINLDIKILHVGGERIYDRKNIIEIIAKKFNKKIKIDFVKKDKIELDSNFKWPENVSFNISMLKKFKKKFIHLEDILETI